MESNILFVKIYIYIYTSINIRYKYFLNDHCSIIGLRHTMSAWLATTVITTADRCLAVERERTGRLEKPHSRVLFLVYFPERLPEFYNQGAKWWPPKPLGFIFPRCYGSFQEGYVDGGPSMLSIESLEALGSVYTMIVVLWENYISISFHIEWDMIVVTIFLSIFWTRLNSIWFRKSKTVPTIISHSIWKEVEILVFSLHRNSCYQ